MFPTTSGVRAGKRKKLRSESGCLSMAFIPWADGAEPAVDPRECAPCRHRLPAAGGFPPQSRPWSRPAQSSKEQGSRLKGSSRISTGRITPPPGRAKMARAGMVFRISVNWLLTRCFSSLVNWVEVDLISRL